MPNQMSAGYGNPQNAYKQTAVETASPEKLLVMLFTGGLKFLRQGEKALADGDYEEAHNYLTRVQDIITELNTTLDVENGGEIAANLRELYNFYFMRIVSANIKKDPELLKPVIEFFATYRDVWSETARLARMGAK